MTNFPNKGQTKKEEKIPVSPVFQILKHIGVYLLLITATTMLLRPLHLSMIEHVRDIGYHLIGLAEDTLGRKITYTSIGPSIFRTIDIRNVKIYEINEDNETQPVMTVSRLRVSYSIFALLRGDMTNVFRSVRIESPVVHIDRERDADLLELFGILPTAETQIVEVSLPLTEEEKKERRSLQNLREFMPDQIQVIVQNGELAFTGAERSFNAADLNFSADITQERLRFNGRGSGAFIFADVSPHEIRASFNAKGETSTDLQNGNAVVSVTAFSENLFRLEPLTLNLSLFNNKIELKKISTPSILAFSAEYDIIENSLSGTLRGVDFSPNALISLSGSLQQYQPYLDFKSSGVANFIINSDGVNYDLDFLGFIPFLQIAESFVVRAKGDSQAINFDNLALYINNGSLAYRGKLVFESFLPDGVVSFSNFSLSNSGNAFDAEIAVKPNGKEVALSGRNLRFGSVAIADLNGYFLHENNNIAFRADFQQSAGNSADTSAGVTLEGFASATYSATRVVMDSLFVKDILEIISPFYSLPDVRETAPPHVSHILDNLITSNEVFITTDFEHFAYHIPHFRLSLSDTEKGTVENIFSGVISGTDRRFQLNSGAFTWEDLELSARFYTDFSNLEAVTFSVALYHNDRPYYFDGTILDQNSISIEGLYGLRFYMSRADAGGYSAYIEMENFPILQSSRLSLRSSIRYDSPEYWFTELERFELAEFTTPTSNASVLSFSGRVDQSGSVFREIFFNDGRGALLGNAHVSWNQGFSAFTGAVRLNSEQGNEWYDVSGGVSGNIQSNIQDLVVALSVSGANMQLARFIPEIPNTVASGDVDIMWEGKEAFSANVHLSMLSVNLGDADLYVTGDAELTSEQLSFQNVYLRHGAIVAEIPFITANRLQSRMESRANLYLLNPNSDAELSFSMMADFQNMNSWFDFEDAINVFNGSLHISSAHFNTIYMEEPADFTFSRNNTLFSLSGGPNDLIEMKFDNSGDFYAGLFSPFPIRGTVIGNIDVANNSIDAVANDIYVDLTALWLFIPNDVKKNIIDITGGFATASVRIKGNLTDPEFFGTAMGHSVRLAVPQFLNREVRAVPMLVTLEGNEMFFGPIPAGVGQGQGTVEGIFTFDRWIPNTFSLDIRAPQRTALPVSFDLSGVIVRGNVSGHLNISLADSILSVTGNLIADDTEITLNTEEIAHAQNASFTVTDSYLSGIVVNINVRSGRQVEFLWPNAQWPILQAYADIGSNLRIFSDTVSQRYSFVGDIRLRSGEIFYFERSFYIRSGLLSFNENETHFDPRITVRAEVRDQASTGPVTIAMIVENAPLQSFTARFESSPPLSQTDIFYLLGQSLVGTESGGTDARLAFIGSTADILAQTQLYRRFQRSARDFLALDMLSFRTQVMQNLILRNIARANDEVDNIGFGNYFDNTAVFIGKYITPDMFFQSMFAVRHDPTSAVQMGGGYAFEPDFGIELRGPVFDMQVHVAILNLESLFIRDVSLSITRRWSSWSDLWASFISPGMWAWNNVFSGNN